MGLQPGTKLGNYEIVALLGAGGMGELYRAHDLSLQREASVLRLDLETGKRQLWKTITPAETSGADYVLPLLITTDEKSYVYGLNRRPTNLYVVEGLK
jgi:serine/threonine protein kinase